MDHLYISTACMHAVHQECRLECKFCDAPCLCRCHEEGGAGVRERKRPPRPSQRQATITAVNLESDV